jgi:hypothetical protein
MTLAPNSLYPKTPRHLISLDDLTQPEAEERWRREQHAWRGCAHIERLTAEASVLIVQPGAAAELGT